MGQKVLLYYFWYHRKYGETAKGFLCATYDIFFIAFIKNHLIVFECSSQLLYVDGWNKTLSAIRVDRSDRPQKIADLSKFAQDNPIFGLALGEGFAYVSIWGTGSIVKVPLNQESEPVQILTGLSNECLFSLASTDARGQTASKWYAVILVSVNC